MGAPEIDHASVNVSVLVILEYVFTTNHSLRAADPELAMRMISVSGSSTHLLPLA